MDFPSNEEILFAISRPALGSGAEAKVYKMHTNPKYTVRLLLEFDKETLASYLAESRMSIQPDIFDGRNYAQTVAYFIHPNDREDASPKASVNLYVPGISLEVGRDEDRKFLRFISIEERTLTKLHGPEEAKQIILKRYHDIETRALLETQVLSEKIANMDESVYDKIYDDLHFLSSRRHNIDIGAELFTNTGNILYSGDSNTLNIIDIQPLITRHPGINPAHTKGHNTPLYLTRGLVPGLYKFRNEHSLDEKVIESRTEIVKNVILGAERNGLNDVKGYGMSTPEDAARYWQIQLNKLHVPERYHKEMIRRVTSVEQKKRYVKANKEMLDYKRVAGIND